MYYTRSTTVKIKINKHYIFLQDFFKQKGTTMKLYAPKYYKEFKCIADRCEHSCCIGWEIDVDTDTLEKYTALKSGYGPVIANSICMSDTPHFKLGEHDRCPHLNERGLCEIILHEGEEYLCDICREHPRFYNYTDVAEVGIGMSCPEAARTILRSPDYAVMQEIGHVDTIADGIDFDGRAERSRLYAILQDTALDYQARLESIYSQYAIAAGEDTPWLETLAGLEYLDAAHQDMFATYSSKRRPRDKDEYLERFLAYFIYRHCTEALGADDFDARLAFCLFCERLLASLICSEDAQSLHQIAALASVISEEIEYSDDNTYTLMYG